jgi:hypothetical protein
MNLKEPSQSPAWQRLVINPLTALFFAVCVGVAFYRFPIIDVSGAPYIGAGVVLVSYLMLAKKYDPILSAIFFAVALFLLYKTAFYRPRLLTANTPEISLRNDLSVIAAIAQTATLRDGHPPRTLAELPLDKLAHKPDGLGYCLAAECEKAPTDSNAVFWISATARFPGDNPPETWYLNDRFQAYRFKATSSSFETLGL